VQAGVNRWLAELVCGATTERVDKSYNIFNIPITIRQYVAEYAIPIEHTFAALHALMALIDEKGLCVHAPIEVRFGAGDDFWLSPAFERPSCFIGVIMYRPFGREPAYLDYFSAVEEIMARFEGRPHWGKWCGGNWTTIRKRYPKWAQFSALRKDWDPSGVFLNPFLQGVFA
jgi:L-gulonolactone oxidase